MQMLARWRRATTLALSSITALEDEIGRKTESIREAGAKIVDKDATIASVEHERAALQMYAHRLELHLARLLEACVNEFSGVHATPIGSSPASSSDRLPPDTLASFFAQLTRPSPSGERNNAATTQGVLASQIAELRQAVREGTGSERVKKFFEALEVAPDEPERLDHVRGQSMPVPSTHGQTAAAVDGTTRRALAFVGLPITSETSVIPAKSVSLDAVSSAMTALTGGAASVPNAQHLSSQPLALEKPAIDTVSLEIDLHPSLYPGATVGQLKAAVAARTGRQPHAISLFGHALVNDSQLLIDAGVPMTARIDVAFLGSAAAAPTGGMPTAASDRRAPPTPSGPHISMPLAPLPYIAHAAPPPTGKQPLPIPTPHNGPLELSTAPAKEALAITSPASHQEGESANAAQQALDSRDPDMSDMGVDEGPASLISEGIPTSLPATVPPAAPEPSSKPMKRAPADDGSASAPSTVAPPLQDDLEPAPFIDTRPSSQPPSAPPSAMPSAAPTAAPASMSEATSEREKEAAVAVAVAEMAAPSTPVTMEKAAPASQSEETAPCLESVV
ncbi:MAG: hypothetical protein EOO65_03320, partial [Methanosarcinales archaeon]